jgi:hypothetical protein
MEKQRTAQHESEVSISREHDGKRREVSVSELKGKDEIKSTGETRYVLRER